MSAASAGRRTLRQDDTAAPPSHLRELLAAHQQNQPDAPAIADVDGRVLSYASLAELAWKTGATLRNAGIGPRDRVGLVLPDGPDAATAFLSVAAAATTAPLNPNYRAPELEFYLQDLDAKAVIVPHGVDGDAVKVAQERNILVLELVSCHGAPGMFELRSNRASSPVMGESVSEDVALVLHTSGTTARPKIVPLTHANLCRSAKHTAAALALSPGDRCLNVMPLFHVHGLIGALLSTIWSGGSIVCTPGFNAAKFLSWVGDLQPSWYTAVPTMHQAVVDRAALQPVRPTTSLRLIRSCSAALPPTVLGELERLFNVPVIEAYGMTEAAHQISSNPLPPLEHKPGSTGVAAGPDVAVLTDDGQVLGTGQIGEIAIKGPNVTRGYADPNANESAFIHGWFRTGDQGYLDEDGYIFLTGRIKELINRGGEKLAPREIDEALLAHPAVSHVVAFGIPDARLGEVVAAAVVLRPGAEATERQLREFVGTRLAFFKIPTRIAFVTELPKGPTGKLQRRGLGEKLGLTGAREATAQTVDAIDAPVLLVLEIASAVLGVEDIGPDAGFIEAGGDSLLATQFVARLQETFGVDVSFLDLFDASSFEALACLIAERILADVESLTGDLG